MKLKFQKILSISILVVLVFSTIPSKVFATADASITADQYDIKVNQLTSIYVSVSSAEAWNLSVSASGGSLSGILSSANSVVGGTSDTVINASFSANIPGSYTITVSGTVSSSEDVNNEVVNNVTKSITINVSANEQPPEQGGNTSQEPEITDPGSGNETQDPPSSEENNNNLPTEQPTTPPAQTEPEPEVKSNNNYLRSLKVDKGTLTPAFSREREDYTIEFPEDFDYSTLENINVSATVENNKAKINGTGNITVKEGENVIEINVMAEDQTVRTYRITFIKPEIIEQSDLRLRNLTIKAIDEDEKSEDVELQPKFDAEVFDYKLEVKDNIEKLQIDTEVEREDIIVTVEGADKLHSGKNLIKITLTSPTDENVKSVYQITVNKDKAIVASTNPTDGVISAENRTKIIIGIVLGIIAILGITLVTLLIINHKKNKQEQAGNEDDEIYDRVNKKNNKEKLKEKKQKLFDYEEEKSYLTDENLEKLSDEYKEAVKNLDKEDLGKSVKHKIIADEIDAKEKEKNKKTNEVSDNMDFEEESKNNGYDKLAELLERKEYTSSNEEEKVQDKSNDNEEGTFNKEDFLNDIKNKKGKHF